MTGLEYLREDALAGWWADLDALVRDEIRQHAGGAQAYLSEKNPLWRFVGRVTFHLAENKRDAEQPVRLPGDLCQPPVGPGPRPARAPGRGRCSNTPAPRTGKHCCRCWCPFSGRPSAAPWSRSWSIPATCTTRWRGRRARRTASCRTFPIFEESGLIVRVPDWWKPHQPAAARSSMCGSTAGAGPSWESDALLDFSVGVALDGEPLSEAELQELLASADGLVRLKGKWVEVDREKLAEALAALANRRAQRAARAGCRSLKGCACWRAPRWSATRRRPCRKRPARGRA